MFARFRWRHVLGLAAASSAWVGQGVCRASQLDLYTSNAINAPPESELINDWISQTVQDLSHQLNCKAPAVQHGGEHQSRLTRYQAAQFLLACLDDVGPRTDLTVRLFEELSAELQELRASVMKLDARYSALQATQFSATTKLQIEINSMSGAVAFGGNLGGDTSPLAVSQTNPTGSLPNGFSSNYDVRLQLATSWTGKDLLLIRLRSGNVLNSAFRGATYDNLMALDKSYAIATRNNVVEIDRFYYRFPLSTTIHAVFGPLARNLEVVAFRPQAYDADILDFFTLAGAPGTYRKIPAATIALQWRQPSPKHQPYWTASLSYGAARGNNATPNQQNPITSGGLFNQESRGNILAQIGYRASNWGIAAAYSWSQCGLPAAQRGTTLASQPLPCNQAGTSFDSATNSVALSAFWQPIRHSLMPAVSIGWGLNAYSQQGPIVAANNVQNVAESQSWALALQWKDLLRKGDANGFAFGQPTMVTRLRSGLTPNDGNYAFEFWYRYAFSNAISITPAIFYLSNPAGQVASAIPSNNGSPSVLTNLGALVMVTFRF